MTDTRYCSTCGALLSQGAVVCGECGARFQASPFHKKATDAPDAWGKAPIPRRTAPEADAGAGESEPGVEIISRESLQPAPSGMTAMRSGAAQYDRAMAAQNHPSHTSAPSAAAPSAPEGGSEENRGQLDPPLDACVPSSVGKRLLAWLIDGVIGALVAIPLAIGATLIALRDHAGLLAQILVGIGVVLPTVYWLVLLWLEGTRGLTPGKAAMGLRTARFSRGGPIGLGRALGRSVLLGIPLVGLVMAISVLFDPRHVRRGFHDRALDAIVLDIREGRNGIQPRPDDFERQGAEHYMPSGAVAVTTHDNLMSAPGAAWGVGSPSSAPSGSDPAGTAGGDATGWAPDPAVAPSHQGGYGPQDQLSGYAPQGQQGGFAPQDQQGGHAPQGQLSGYAPQGQLSGYAPQGQQGGYAAPAHQVGDAARDPQAGPAPQGPPVPYESQARWDDPAPQGGYGAPAFPTEHGQQPGRPEDFPGARPADAVAPAASGADPADEDDDRTRMSVPVAAAGVQTAPRLRIRLEDGTEREGDAPLVLGRNPAPVEGRTPIAIEDASRSVSKTHLLLEVEDGAVRATDLGSTNGSALIGADEHREPLTARTAVEVPAGTAVALGDRTIHVELLT